MRKTPACKATDTYFITYLAKKTRKLQLKRGTEANERGHVHSSTCVFSFSTSLVLYDENNIRRELSLNSYVAR